MRNPIGPRLAVVGLAGWLVASPWAWGAERVDRYVIVSNAARVGTMTVRVTTNASGDDVDVDLRVDNNGRGVKLRERIRRDAAGQILEWRIQGAGDSGAPVDETFRRAGPVATWKSLNDEGKAEATGESLYLPNEASPWYLGEYARIALRASGGTVQLLPGGVLRAARLREVRLGAGGGTVTTAVALSGYGLSPDYVLLGADGRFLAYVSDGGVIADEALAGAYEELTALARELDAQALAGLARRASHRHDGPIVLRNVRVFDGVRARVGEATTVVVYRGRIASVRGDVSPGSDALVLDGGGGTVLPGLCDAHGHLYSWDGPLHIAAGVTTVRDPGNDNDSLLALVARIDAGEVLGPRVIRAGFLEGKSPYSANLGFVVDSREAALEKVRWYADHGYRQIKIYNSMNPEWVKSIAAEAHKLGLRVAGHVPAFMTSERAVQDGYDEISHVNQLLLSFVIDPKEDTRTPFRFTALGERLGTLDLQAEPFQRMVRLMKARGTTLDPTVETFEQLLLGRPGVAPPSDAGWVTHMPASVQRGRRMAALDVKPASYPAYEASWRKLLETIRLLDAEGIRIVPGTDSGVAGLSLHAELETWVQAGIPPARVLQLATWECARYFGQDQQFGSIEPGKVADLLLVDGDPVADLATIRKVRLVMKDGVVFYPEEIHRALGVEPFASRPPPPPSAAAGAGRGRP
jgi:imidazolonepropionase-like amidohydrolase